MGDPTRSSYCLRLDVQFLYLLFRSSPQITMSIAPAAAVPVRVRDEDKCPICLGLKIAVVTLPCGHEVCKQCYGEIELKSNFNCPFCRKRLSNWSRKVTKLKQLVNQKRWEEIRDKYPDLVRRIQQKLAQKADDKENSGSAANGQEDDDMDEDEYNMQCDQVIRDMAEPGEIRKEFEEQLAKEEEIRRREQQKEEQLSLSFIKRQLADENERVTRQRKMEQDDERYARALQRQMDQEAAAKGEDVTRTKRRSAKRKNDPVIENEHCYAKKPATG
jgi:hypothetical protein